MLTYADVCGTAVDLSTSKGAALLVELDYNTSAQHILTYADVCLRMLTYAAHHL
jgi:hypothetical protein